ncbi:MAG: signal recognition particle protein [Candidatus Methylomirabilis sp.]|nr:signal recognition particle protein [Deltaproteobacteria bacterium]
MFENLGDKLSATIKKVRGQGKISEANIAEAMKEVRLALLEADVNFKVAKGFVEAVKARALGADVIHTVSPGQAFIKIVYEELVALMGGEATRINLSAQPPVVILMVGLQGSGKTTSTGKLANYLRKHHKRTPYLVPADVYRPAAIEQLQTLARSLNIPVHPSTTEMNPVDIARAAVEHARGHDLDLVILDTAGRLHIDEELMAELRAIKAAVGPTEILFVADAMTGQDAITVADKFNKALDLTGVILTKMDGDARGGAALSIKAITDKPIKFVGMGEKLSDLEVFHADRIAGRILGMGDVLTFVEKAQQVVDQKHAEEMRRKMLKAEFTLEDFLSQLGQLEKMGSLESLMDMIPGMAKMKKQMGAPDEKELGRVKAIIQSMTPTERVNHSILNGSRRKRIAAGSGTSVTEVNQLLKQFLEMKKMMKTFSKGKGLRKLLAADL